MTIRPTEFKDPIEGPPRGDRQIFLCDASAEAGRLLTQLQTKGYSVVDVPLGLLLSRCRHEVPEVIICDADAHEAERRLTELNGLEIPNLKLILFGHEDGALRRLPALKELADFSFVRPLDQEAIVLQLAKLCSPPRKRSHRPRVGRPGLMPSLVAAARKPYRSDARLFDTPPQAFEREEPSDAAWPIDSPPSRGPLISDAPPKSERRAPTTPLVPPPESSGFPLSPATVMVLEKGRRRLESYAKQGARPVRLPVGAHSVGSDLRPELLAALEEPLDDTEYGARLDDDLPESTSPGTRSPASTSNRRDLSGIDSAPPPSHPAVGTNPEHGHFSDSRPFEDPYQFGVGGSFEEHEEKTNPGGRPGGTHPPPRSSPTNSGDADAIVMDDLSDLLSSPWSADPPEPDSVEPPQSDDLNTTKPPKRPNASRASPLDLDSVHEDPALDEGDFAAAPSLPASLFTHMQLPQDDGTKTEHRPTPMSEALNATGDASPRSARHLPLLSAILAQSIRERVTGAVAQQDKDGVRRVLLTDGDITTVISAVRNESLSHFLHARGDITKDILSTLGAIPAFGRHAGAALIARGLLQQEDLWPVLRAHAEWILTVALRSTAETVLELDVPQRLLDEPAVFGGAAGTEIYLDALRRVITPEQAFAALGRGDRVLGRGQHTALMGESALTARDQQVAWDSVGQPLEPLMRRDPKSLPLLLGLTQLGVLTAGGGGIALEKVHTEARNAEIEDEAFTSKLMARRGLVDDGDYFALLGISRSATGYEVDRARDELLSLFSEDQLTGRTLHLRPDLELLRATIEEAHLVLRDDVRRYRYRRALEAMPK